MKDKKLALDKQVYLCMFQEEMKATVTSREPIEEYWEAQLDNYPEITVLIHDYEMKRYPYEQEVKGPGKFEGEPAYVPYFWEKEINGSNDDEIWDEETNYIISVFHPTKDDIYIFPELTDIQSVYVWETDTGFVHSKEIDKQGRC